MKHLDAFDQAILEIVEGDNTLSHQAIADAVHLSASSVRRRLTAMRNNGVIVADVSLTDPSARGLTFITMVTFEKESQSIYDAFREQISREPAVSQSYSVSGALDFVLIVHAKSPEAFEAWGERVLMSNPNLARYTTSVVWSRQKFTTKILPC